MSYVRTNTAVFHQWEKWETQNSVCICSGMSVLRTPREARNVRSHSCLRSNTNDSILWRKVHSALECAWWLFIILHENEACVKLIRKLQKRHYILLRKTWTKLNRCFMALWAANELLKIDFENVLCSNFPSFLWNIARRLVLGVLLDQILMTISTASCVVFLAFKRQFERRSEAHFTTVLIVEARKSATSTHANSLSFHASSSSQMWNN